MDIVHALLPNLCIGMAGVPIAMRLMPHLYFPHVLAYMAAYSMSAAGASVWIGVTYGSIGAGIGGFLLALVATTLGLFIGLGLWAMTMEYGHRRRHRLGR